MSVTDNNNAVLQSILNTLSNSTPTGLKNTFGFSFNETDLNIIYKLMQDYVRRKNEMNEEIKLESLQQLVIDYIAYYANTDIVASQEFFLFINPTGLDDKYKNKQNPPLIDLIKNKERGRALKENIKGLQEGTKISELEEEIEVLTRQRNELLKQMGLDFDRQKGRKPKDVSLPPTQDLGNFEKDEEGNDVPLGENQPKIAPSKPQPGIAPSPDRRSIPVKRPNRRPLTPPDPDTMPTPKNENGMVKKIVDRYKNLK